MITSFSLIRVRMNERTGTDKEGRLHNLQPGDRVTLAETSLNGLVGTVHSLDGDRILIEVQRGCYLRCPRRQLQGKQEQSRGEA
jgi:preprotein translocase subunit YajC